MSTKKLNKHLNKYNDKGRPPIKRIKSLSEYLALKNEDEQINFYVAKHKEILPLLVATFRGEVSGRKKKTKLPSSSEYNTIFTILNKLILYASEAIRNTWGIDELYQLLKSTTSLENKPAIREKGLNTLILFIDVLAEKTTKEIYDLLRSTINFHPFLVDYQKNIALLSQPNNTAVLGSKETTKDTKEEKLKLFGNLLDYISNKTLKPHFWINTLENCFFVTLYPGVAKKLNLIETSTENGFNEHCPHEIQCILIEHVLVWIQADNHAKFILETARYRSIIFEIFRQSFFLPIQYDSTLYKVLERYEFWLKSVKQRPLLIHSELHSYLIIFLDNMLEAFLMEIEKEKTNEILRRLTRYLISLKFIAEEKYDLLSRNTWDFFLTKAIRTFQRIYLERDQTFRKMIWPRIIACLFTIFFYSKTKCNSHWQGLKALFSLIREDFQTIVMWKRLLYDITIKFNHILFGFKANQRIITEENKLKFQRINRGNSHALFADSITRNKFSLDFFPDIHLLPATSQEEIDINYEFDLNISNWWDNEYSVFFWKKIFNLLGNVNHFKNEKMHESAIISYIEILDLIYRLYQAIDNKDMLFLAQQNLPILKLFGPIFFESCLLGSSFLSGRSLSYGAVGIMLCDPYRINPLSYQELSYFYTVVSLGLSIRDEKVISNILRYTSQIFSYSFPGSIGLINSYLNLISLVMDTNNTTNYKDCIYLHCLTCLSSLISLQDHFTKLEIYNYTKLLQLDQKSTNGFLHLQNLLNKDLVERENFASEIDKIINQYGEYIGENKDSIFIINQDIKTKIQTLTEKEFKRQSNFPIWDKDNELHDLTNYFLFPVQSIRLKIIKIISNFLTGKGKNLHQQLILHSLWIISTLAVNELNSQRGNEQIMEKEIIEISLKCLNQFVDNPNIKIAETANHGLLLIAPFSKIINNLAPNFLPNLIKNQCNLIMSYVSKLKNFITKYEDNENDKQKQSTVPPSIPILLRTAQSFITNLPVLLFNKELNQLFFSTLFACLGFSKSISEIIKESNLSLKKSFSYVKTDYSSNKENININTTTSININNDDDNNDNVNLEVNEENIQNFLHLLVLETKKKKNRDLYQKKRTEEEIENNFSFYHTDYSLMNSAEIVLLNLLNNWNNYPLCEGPEWNCSLFTDDYSDIPEEYLNLEVFKKKTEKEKENEKEKEREREREIEKEKEKNNNINNNNNNNNQDNNNNKELNLQELEQRNFENFDKYSEAFALKEGTIIILYDLPIKVNNKRERSVVRVILRDVSGKYVWDIEPLYANLDEEEIEKPFIPQKYQTNNNEEFKLIAKNLPKLPEYERKQTVLPRYNAQLDISTTDMLGEMLQYIGETFESESKINFNSPIVGIPSGKSQQFNEIKQNYSSQQSSLDNFVQSVKDNNEKKCDNIKPPKSFDCKNHFHLSKILFSQLGLFSMTNKEDLIPIKRNDRFSRALKELDKRPSREMQKIGVIYVAPGQTHQNDILSNEFGSPLYEEFVNGLGWEIDISKHVGYNGGLDVYSGVNGRTCPYYADSETEVVFHTITRMPNSETNIQQIHKKKHVGNDIVQIVWCENVEQDYDPATITSRFNHVHIVIYPLPNGLFRIQIFMKESVKFFGPLLTGMIISKKDLPYLARTTAMCAYRYVRYETRGYQHPFPTRWDLINETINRYQMDLSFDQYFSRLIVPKGTEEHKRK
ncbi:tuberin [Anaeramoeba flamelloides]|uniref:Tuberin n=1 Tax=Anaeramoeba flamelloides TaxID=1746091 RepID=A0AAV7ZDT1_9EUKA|nr:tuberin [Anaeramoeba flamelloides]